MNKQKGSVLIIVILLMSIISLLIMHEMEEIGLAERINRHYLSKVKSFWNAETSLHLAKDEISNNQSSYFTQCIDDEHCFEYQLKKSNQCNIRYFEIKGFGKSDDVATKIMIEYADASFIKPECLMKKMSTGQLNWQELN